MSNAVSRLTEPAAPVVLREWIDAERLLGIQSATPARETPHYILTPATEASDASHVSSAAGTIQVGSIIAAGLSGLPLMGVLGLPLMGISIHPFAFGAVQSFKTDNKSGWKIIPDAAVGTVHEWLRSKTVQDIGDVEVQQAAEISAPQCANWFHGVVSSIDTFAQRGEDWDGDGGLPPDPNAVLDAKSFAYLVAARHHLRPTGVYAPTDGEVMFQWKRDGLFLEVGFYGDNSISWYAQHSGRERVFGDDDFHRDRPELPSGLIEALAAVGSQY